MKYLTFAAAALALAACSQPASTEAPPPAPAVVNVPTGTYEVDPTHTTVAVRVKHFGLSNYVFRLNTVSGTLNFNAEDPTQSTIEATVQAGSLDTPYAGDRDFDAELQNSEWLDAATHPTATFRSTSIESTGPSTARVTGDLTIKGVTRPITLEATYNTSHAVHPMGFPIQQIGFSAHGALNRLDYGLGANTLVPSTADASDGVATQVELVIEAEFTRPAPASTETPAPATPAEPVN